MSNKEFDLISYNQSEEFNKNLEEKMQEHLPIDDDDSDVAQFITVLATYFMIIVNGKTVEDIMNIGNVSEETAISILSFAELIGESKASE